MPVTETEVLAGINLGDAANAEASAVFLSQLEEGNPAWNPEVTSIIPAGHTHPSHVGLQSNREEVPITTQQIASLIARLGLFGDNCSASTVYYRTIANMDGPTAHDAAAHTVFTAAKAFCYLMSISAGHRRQASARARLVTLYDGANPVLARIGTGTLAHSPTAGEVFELGPLIYPGGTRIEGADNFDLQLNPVIQERSDDSEKRTTYASVRQASPVLSFTSTDRDVGDMQGSVAGFKFHFVRMKNLDQAYGPTEAQHILGNIPQGILLRSAKQDDPSAYRMELHVAGNPAAGWADVPIEWTINSQFSLT